MDNNGQIQNQDLSLMRGGLAVSITVLAAMVTWDVYHTTKGKVSDYLEKRKAEKAKKEAEEAEKAESSD